MVKKKKKRKQIHADAMGNSREEQKEFHLSIALQAAVPLWVYELYEQGGPTLEDVERSRKFGRTLAANGDKLLFQSPKKGETAALFNQLAEAIAVMSYNVGGTPKIFGQNYEASQLLSGFIGQENAAAYCQKVLKQWPETDGSQGSKQSDE